MPTLQTRSRAWNAWAFHAATLVLLLSPLLAAAHAFVQPYTLPVPFSMYAFGAATALVLSFCVVGVFARTPPRVPEETLDEISHPGAHQPTSLIWGSVSFALLVLCIATGLLGTQNPFANFNMTFFWIVFVLGVPHLASLLGDFYASANPWRAWVRAVEWLVGARFEGRCAYPSWLGYWPSLVLYMAFIWLELYGNLRPFGVSVALVTYTAINGVGAWLFGTAAWFRHGEFFGVMLRLIGAMAPLTRLSASGTGGSRRAWAWRAPFNGLLRLRADHVSLVPFILFMLSSTAFDGLHSTRPWVNIFWKTIYPAIEPWATGQPGQKYALSTQLYYVWQWASLLVSPLVYFAVFLAFVWGARAIGRSTAPLSVLLLRFSVSLVPIAFVYHVTHYYTLVLLQAGQIVRLASDPFGLGWNLFGTATMAIWPVMVSVDAIWHTQVALILIGHIVSVYLAHLEALRLFATPRAAAASQLPMLVLMVVFTTFGLWILSLPLASG